jgi:hypothetical protein
MLRVSKMKQPQSITVSPKTLLECLHLPTADDTQTAFAKLEIFISETTAVKWRKMAHEDGVDAIQLPPVDEPPPRCMERVRTIVLKACWKQREHTFGDNVFV